MPIYCVNWKCGFVWDPLRWHMHFSIISIKFSKCYVISMALRKLWLMSPISFVVTKINYATTKKVFQSVHLCLIQKFAFFPLNKKWGWISFRNEMFTPVEAPQNFHRKLLQFYTKLSHITYNIKYVLVWYIIEFFTPFLRLPKFFHHSFHHVQPTAVCYCCFKWKKIRLVFILNDVFFQFTEKHTAPGRATGQVQTYVQTQTIHSSNSFVKSPTAKNENLEPNNILLY